MKTSEKSNHISSFFHNGVIIWLALTLIIPCTALFFWLCEMFVSMLQ